MGIARKIKFGSKSEQYVGLVLIIAFILPHTNTILQLVNPLMALLLFASANRNFYKEGLFPILAVAVSIAVGILGSSGSKAVMTACTIIMYIALFPEIKFESIKNVYIYIIFAILFLSQMAFVLHISPLISVIDTIYPNTWEAGEHLVDSMKENVALNNLSEFRNGGLYRNPNQYAKFVTFLQGIYLSLNFNVKFRYKLPFLLLCVFSVLLTGSRTGFIISYLLAFVSFYIDNKGKTSTKLISLLVIATAVFWFLNNADEIGFRGAAISEGLEDSAGAKLAVLLMYLDSGPSIMALAFGNLDFSRFDSGTLYGFDSEYGYITYCYGFVGLFAFISFYYKLYRNTPKEYRVFYIVLLWMVSSSIFMAYRAAFVFVLLVSSIYKNKRINNTGLSRNG